MRVNKRLAIELCTTAELSRQTLAPHLCLSGRAQSVAEKLHLDVPMEHGARSPTSPQTCTSEYGWATAARLGMEPDLTAHLPSAQTQPCLEPYLLHVEALVYDLPCDEQQVWPALQALSR
mmetsp:Transcript_27379/g.78892  ORF Transcript_27379/g.78892 Transcript_27379/m.78892 type:complete len:120 (+) Transcript_27379:255-614(+)